MIHEMAVKVKERYNGIIAWLCICCNRKGHTEVAEAQREAEEIANDHQNIEGREDDRSSMFMLRALPNIDVGPLGEPAESSIQNEIPHPDGHGTLEDDYDSGRQSASKRRLMLTHQPTATDQTPAGAQLENFLKTKATRNRMQDLESISEMIDEEKSPSGVSLGEKPNKDTRSQT